MAAAGVRRKDVQGHEQGKLEQVKVHRYVAGQVPDWVVEDNSDEDLLLDASGQKKGVDAQRRTMVAEVLVTSKARRETSPSRSVSDPRLERLRHVGSIDQEERLRARQQRRQVAEPEVLSARDKAQEDELAAQEFGGGDEEEMDLGDDWGPAVLQQQAQREKAKATISESAEDVQARRQRALERRKRQEIEEEELLAGSEHEAHEELLGSDSDSSEYETDTDESDEDDFARSIRLKPVFVSKAERETIAERDRRLEEEQRMAEQRRTRLEARKKETHQMVLEEVRKEEERLQAGGSDSDDERPDTDDDTNEAEEYEAWKGREMQRIRREREEQEKYEEEQADKERRSKMTDEELIRENAEIEGKSRNVQEKKKWNFLQKFYHKGAFFMDWEDRGRLKEDLYARDYGEAVGADKFDKANLPKIMQVKNFGLRGRTKYTHLKDQDTTTFDANPIYDSRKSGISGGSGITSALDPARRQRGRAPEFVPPTNTTNPPPKGGSFAYGRTETDVHAGVGTFDRPSKYNRGSSSTTSTSSSTSSSSSSGRR